MNQHPIRVAHVITRMVLGGAQENTVQTCDLLRRAHGWDVTLFTGPPIGPEGELLGDVRRRGIPCTLIPHMRRSVNPCLDLLAFHDLVRRFRQLRPAIVHTHSSKAGLLGRLAARAARVPVVVHHIRGLPFHPYAPWYANAAFIAAERCAAAATDRFACVADAMTRGAVGAGLAPPDRFCVIRSGMDVDAYDAAAGQREAVREHYGFAPDDIVVGKIARLFHLKGHGFVIRAGVRLIEHCPQVKFLFVGDGILRDELADLARSLGILHRIAFAGLVPPERIPATMSAMDMVVHASLREGLARVLVQGLLSRKPVVTYDLDGAPEVIEDMVTGRLVPAESVDGLADALLWCIEHPAESAAIAEAGRRRVADEFRIEETVRQTDRMYRELLAQKGLACP